MGASERTVPCNRHCQHFRQHNSLRTIAAVGDSITYGTCASDRALKSWPAQLQRGYLSQDPTVRVLNFGASGRTMTRSGDNPYWDDAEFDRAKASNADAFVIGLGTNDAKHYNWNLEEFEQDYRDMVAIFQGLDAEVYLVVPPPLYEDGAYDMNATVINHIFPSLIPRIANETGATGVIDVFDALGGALLNAPELFCDYQSCDACHPNDAGYDRLAGVVFRELFYRPDLPLLAGEVINPPLNAPDVIAEWKPPASFYLAMAPAIALAVVVANLCLGVFWTCYHTARACGGPQRTARPYDSVSRRSPMPASDIELA